MSPAETPPGTTVIIRYRGADDNAELGAFAGKAALEVVARRPGSMVARLPADMAYGRAKLRIADGDQRSKPYDLRIKAQNWRKPFRGLVGGLALLAFGIAVLARGIRETVGIGSARRLASLARNTPAALGFGTVAGALVQSTTAAAGLLAGLVTSSVIAVGPAAVAFLGAQLGAARRRFCRRGPRSARGHAGDRHRGPVARPARRIGGRRRSVGSCWAPA